MSAETALVSALTSYAALTTWLGTVDGKAPDERICVDAVPQGFPKPYIAISQTGSNEERGLDNTLLGRITTFDIQVVGTERLNAIDGREHVRNALVAIGNPSDRGFAGYDPDLDVEVEVVSVDWIEV